MMRLTPRSRQITTWVIVPLFIAACLIAATIRVGRFVHAETKPGTVRSIKIGEARPGTLYAFTAGLKDSGELQGNDAVHVTVNDAKGEVESKWLHAADLDFYLTLSPRAAGPVTVSLSSASEEKVPEVSATLSKILAAAAKSGTADL